MDLQTLIGRSLADNLAIEVKVEQQLEDGCS